MEKNQCENFIRSLTLPAERVDMVLAGSGQPQLSGSPQVVFDLNFTAATGSVPAYQAAGDTFVVCQRNPAWAYLYCDSNATNQAYSYTLKFASLGFGSAFGTLVSPVIIGATGAAISTGSGALTDLQYILPVAQMTSNNAYSPHGPTFYACQDAAGRPWVWVDGGNGSGTTLTITTSAGNNIGDLSWVSYYSDPITGDNVIDPLASGKISTAGNSTVQFTYSGYYTFELHIQPTGSASSANISVAAVLTGGAQVICHNPLPGYAQSANLYGDLRILGVSLLATCVSPALYRNGDVVITQQPESKPWIELLGNSANFTAPGALYTKITSTTPSNYYKVLSWEKGAYGFLKPENGLSTLQNMPYKVAATTVNDTAQTGAIKVVSPWRMGDYLLCHINTLPTVATVGTPAGISRFTLDFWVNYTPMSTWLSPGYSEMSTVEMLDCIDKVAKIQQFYENPGHLILGGIAKMLGGALGAFGRGAKAVAGKVLPSFGRAAKSVATTAAVESMNNLLPAELQVAQRPAMMAAVSPNLYNNDDPQISVPMGLPASQSSQQFVQQRQGGRARYTLKQARQLLPRPRSRVRFAQPQRQRFAPRSRSRQSSLGGLSGRFSRFRPFGRR
jgi:hypothetical protein